MPPLLQPIREIATLLVVAGLLASTPGFAQTVTDPPAATGPAHVVAKVSAEEAGYAKKSMDELEQMVAPVALYPDELLAQILPASTSPLDVVKAHQLLEREPNLKEPPAEAVENWEPAIVSLMQFRDVIKMMAEDVAWTAALGEAVYFQEEEVYGAIQLVRSKAKTNGLLTDNEQQVYVTDNQIIRIEPADPQVIYVPKYNPQVIYVREPAVGPQPFLSFATGVAVIWGLSWAFDWDHRTCVHHHHWNYPWHHHRYNYYYGRPYYSNGRPLRPPSYLPPVRPPRPPAWRPPGQRPPGYRPPRPSQPIALPGRPGPGSGDRWRPARLPVGGSVGKRPTTRPAIPGKGPVAPTTRPSIPGKGPVAPTTRPSIPGKGPVAPTTRPSIPGKGPTAPSTRPAVPGKGPSAPSTRPAVPGKGPSKPATRPSAPAKAPSKPATRPSAPAKAPTKPAARPSAPAKAPTKPAARPSAPAKAPVKPAARPSAPAKAPARPAARPSAPAKPATRPAIPSQPSAKPAPKAGTR